MKVNRVRQNVFPMIAALIWGTSFVAQSVSADHVEAFNEHKVWDTHGNEYILTDIYYKSNSTYVGDLIKKYFEFEYSEDENGKKNIALKKNDCPVWAFMEIITFGDFTKFYSCLQADLGI